MFNFLRSFVQFIKNLWIEKPIVLSATVNTNQPLNEVSVFSDNLKIELYVNGTLICSARKS